MVFKRGDILNASSCEYLVRSKGVEPLSREAHGPKPCVYTNSTTSARILSGYGFRRSADTTRSSRISDVSRRVDLPTGFPYEGAIRRVHLVALPRVELGTFRA